MLRYKKSFFYAVLIFFVLFFSNIYRLTSVKFTPKLWSEYSRSRQVKWWLTLKKILNCHFIVPCFDRHLSQIYSKAYRVNTRVQDIYSRAFWHAVSSCYQIKIDFFQEEEFSMNRQWSTKRTTYSFWQTVNCPWRARGVQEPRPLYFAALNQASYLSSVSQTPLVVLKLNTFRGIS